MILEACGFLHIVIGLEFILCPDVALLAPTQSLGEMVFSDSTPLSFTKTFSNIIVVACVFAACSKESHF